MTRPVTPLLLALLGMVLSACTTLTPTPTPPTPTLPAPAPPTSVVPTTVAWRVASHSPVTEAVAVAGIAVAYTERSGRHFLTGVDAAGTVRF